MGNTLAATARKRTVAVVLVVLSAWMAAVLVASASGALAPLPPLGLGVLILTGILLPTLAYFAFSDFRTLIASFGLRGIAAMHVLRIPPGFVFFWYGAHHILPAQFVQRAGWGDLISGLLALGAVTLWPTRPGYLVFNIVGLADFVTAVATGLNSQLGGNPMMQNIKHLPIVFIPLFGVGILGATHLMSFHMLLKHGAESRMKSSRLPTQAATR